MKKTTAVIKNAVAKRYDTKTMALLGIALAYQVWPSAVAAVPPTSIDAQMQAPSASVVQSMSSQDIDQIRQQPSLRSVR